MNFKKWHKIKGPGKHMNETRMNYDGERV